MELANTKTTRPLQELARRVTDGIDVSLFWDRNTDQVTVYVCDHRRNEYFEIRPAPTQALDAFYHPYSYDAFRDTDWSEEPLVA
jgi:hypothetical protein